MALARTAPHEFGSGRLWYKEVNNDGTDLGTPDTFHSFCLVKDSEISLDFSGSAPKTEVDEGGDSYTVAVTATGGKGSFKGNAFTIDHDLLRSFFVTNRAKYYALVKEVNQTLNGSSKFEYVFMGIAFVTGPVSFKNGTTFPFEFGLLTSSSSITLASTGLVAALTGCKATTISASIVQAAGEMFGVGTGV